MRTEEHNIQVACVRWFDYEYPNHKNLLFAIPNGGHRNKVVACKLKAEGVRAGVADMFLSVQANGFPGVYIEFKTRTGRQQESQRVFQSAVEAQGYRYVIVRSFDEFQKVINKTLNQ